MPITCSPASSVPETLPKAVLKPTRKIERVGHWLSDHPAISIITYSLSIVGAAWVAFFFIYDENRVSVVRAQVESEKATANQYQAKTALLESQLAVLREDNKKYLEWLTGTPKTIPYVEERIRVLSEENAELKTLLASGFKRPQHIPPATNAPYIVKESKKTGEAFVDPKTNATLGIGLLYADFTASAVLTLPGKEPQTLIVKSGDNWVFSVGTSQFRLTMLKVDWYTNTAEIMIKEETSPT